MNKGYSYWWLQIGLFWSMLGLFQLASAQSVCPLPSNVAVINRNGTSAQLVWSAPAENQRFLIRWRRNGTNQWFTRTVTGRNFTMLALSTNTLYEVQLRTTCETNSFSEFTPLLIFNSSTSVSCGVVSNFRVTDTDISSAVLRWNGSTGARTYTIRYRKIEATPQPWRTIRTTNTFINLANLNSGNSGVDYEAEISTNCAGNLSTSFSNRLGFRTKAVQSCNPPENVIIRNIRLTTAVLSWSKDTNAVRYSIDWKRISDPTWTFNWRLDRNDTTYTLANLEPGVSYEVRINTICPIGVTQSAFVNLSFTSGTCEQFRASINKSDVICNGESTGTAILNVTGGVTPYTYRWSNGATTANQINILPAGIFTVTVTDVNNCTTTASAIILQPTTPFNVAATATSVGCGNAPEGRATVTISGGLAPYIFNWSNGVSAQTITNLVAGNYTVTVTDAVGCTKTSITAVVPDNRLRIRLFPEPTTCFRAASGTITTLVQDGLPPYRYAWSDGSTNANPSRLIAGRYTVTVTDISGCVRTASTTITQPDSLQGSIAFSPVNCESRVNLWNLSAQAAGGTQPYTYRWSINEVSQNLFNMETGIYTVTITDANGCQISAVRELRSYMPLASITRTLANNGCLSGNLGFIGVYISGGRAPYRYLWSNGVSRPASNRVADTLGLLPNGRYTVTVIDDNFCVTTAEAEVTGALANMEPVSEIGPTSAKLNWRTGPGAKSFRVAHRIKGTFEWTISNVLSASARSYVLTDLLPFTTYETRVRAECINETLTEWSGIPFTEFTTQNLKCQVVSNIRASDVTTSSARLTWNPPVNSLQPVCYKLQFKENGQQFWRNTLDIPASNTSITLQGLADGAVWDVRMITYCRACNSGIDKSDTLTNRALFQTLFRVPKLSGNTTQIGVNIYPNPAQTVLNIDYANNAVINHLSLTLVDVHGKKVLSQTVSPTLGNNTFTLSVADLPRGLYILQISDDTGIVAKKITLQ